MGKLDLIARSKAAKEKADAVDNSAEKAVTNSGTDSNSNNSNSLRIKLGGSGHNETSASSDSGTVAKLSPLKIALASKGKAATSAATTNPVHVSDEQIADISNINMDTVAVVKPTPAGDAPNLSNYIYEGQAETATEQATEAFYEQLTILEESIGGGFAADNITIILKFLDGHSFLKDILKPEDIGVMVRGLRSSYGTALANASVRRGKKKVVAKEVDDVMDILTDLGI